ncbi:methyl-accepting chemotaxis protein [Exiguobacterium aquaticum]|uniref:methyl-accepting chemotaxis protein n=3 Tax=Bacillales Family XII. Incertae Sedis TaxID=539742 RepID=UPI001BE57872|nr:MULTISPECIES: methyl-accepting chemotaxis protein [Exiguobacterium]MCT4775811.1 methyl-accepting chemotaxis protein [Exiguobacterium aquaticum]
MRRKHDRTITIKQKLITMSLVLLLIPSLLIGFVAYNQAKQKITEQIMQSAHAGVERMNDEITNLIKPIQRDVAFFAGRIDSSLYESGTENLALEEKFLEYLETHPNVTNIYYASTEGEMTIYPAQELPDDYDPRTRPWYEAADAAGGNVVVTDPYVDAASNKMMITLSQTGTDGRGVIAVDVDVDDIAAVAASIQIGKEGYVTILDALQQFVTHPTMAAGEKGEGEWIEPLYAEDTGRFAYEFENKGKQMDFMTNELTGWKIAGTLYDEEITDETSGILWTTVGVIGLMLVLATGLLYVILRSILRPLNRLTVGAERIQAGDLTEDIVVESNDEVGRVAASFNEMTRSLRAIIQNLDQSIGQVAASSQELMANSAQNTAASEQIAGAVQQMAAGADDSKRQLDDNAVSLQAITGGIMRIAESSTDVSELSRETALEAENGTTAVTENVAQMQAIDSSVETFGKVIHSLAERSNEIGNIVDVINGIATQTNLLALNAAIEAARAGENGKGFAVVASEVRKLAEQSQQSTKQISELIDNIKQETERSVQLMKEVSAHTKAGLETTENTAKRFRTIMNQTQAMTPRIEDVTATVEEIAANVEEVSAAATQIAHIADENSVASKQVAATTEDQLGSMEEIAQSAKSLADMAEELQELVSRFNV